MKMRKQRLVGLALIVLSLLVLALAATGRTPEEQDGTAALLLLSLGLYALLSRRDLLY